jgi:hypothetical protein
MPSVMSGIEECKKFESLITVISERKRNVDERLKELSIKFCFK